MQRRRAQMELKVAEVAVTRTTRVPETAGVYAGLGSRTLISINKKLKTTRLCPVFVSKRKETFGSNPVGVAQNVLCLCALDNVSISQKKQVPGNRKGLVSSPSILVSSEYISRFSQNISGFEFCWKGNVSCRKFQLKVEGGTPSPLIIAWKNMLSSS